MFSPVTSGAKYYFALLLNFFCPDNQEMGARDKYNDSQDEVSGYPKVAPSRRALEIPAGDIEAWLAEMVQRVE